MNVFISNKPFYYHSHPFESVHLFTCLWFGGESKYVTAEVSAHRTTCFLPHCSKTSLSGRAWICLTPPFIAGAVLQNSFSDQYLARAERQSLWISLLSGQRLCGWLGTPSCKRDAIMHSARSCWKFTVFHSGFCLNSILILSIEERNVVSGSQCVTARKNT